ncbi:MAG: hypothetical protein JXB34_01685 [Bacteroidales bacterium]|nr:hypothetical protein [Bacteroidales bacterium]
MARKALYVILLIMLSNSLLCQKSSLQVDAPDTNYFNFGAIDPAQAKAFRDSLVKEYNCEVLTGYTLTVFNEIATKIPLVFISGNGQEQKIASDSLGRFFILFDNEIPSSVHLKTSDNKFQPYDSVLVVAKNPLQPLTLMLQPRYSILLKGRVNIGTLPAEGVDVEIVHKSDTFKMKTLSCYFDDEEYWNCLYLGMYKQDIYFDSPTDTVSVSLSKKGFHNHNFALRVGEYDGAIVYSKLKYNTYLPELFKSDISLNMTLPAFSAWMLELNYYRGIKIKNNSRFSAGVSGSIVLTTVNTTQATFRDMGSTNDTTYIYAGSDSTYLTGYFGPTVRYWLNNPARRSFGVYAGLSMPYCFQAEKIYLYPFLGSRFFLDQNKALLVELKYLNYELNVARPVFNPYGNASYYYKDTYFEKLLVNIGLQIGF